MGAKDHDGIIRHLRQFIDEDRSAGPKIVDDVTVVHHLMAHINRAAKDFEGAIHYVDRPVYTGTKPSGLASTMSISAIPPVPRAQCAP
ncbi:MAG: hypothetical protein CM15mP25_3000 [Gammaproteobacteria bacterium]|nr:MAG: hypothetical protein CM15mP25_3000 [Gammaproteobacteria bacterium]